MVFRPLQRKEVKVIADISREKINGHVISPTLIDSLPRKWIKRPVMSSSERGLALKHELSVSKSSTPAEPHLQD